MAAPYAPTGGKALSIPESGSLHIGPSQKCNLYFWKKQKDLQETTGTEKLENTGTSESLNKTNFDPKRAFWGEFGELGGNNTGLAIRTPVLKIKN